MRKHSGGRIHLGFGFAIFRNDTLLAPLNVYTSGNMNSAGWYGTVTYSGSINVTVADDDIIIPVWGSLQQLSRTMQLTVWTDILLV